MYPNHAVSSPAHVVCTQRTKIKHSSCGINSTNTGVYLSVYLVVCLSVCLSQMIPNVSTKPLLRPGWCKVVVQLKAKGSTCLHLENRVVQLGPNPFAEFYNLRNSSLRFVLVNSGCVKCFQHTKVCVRVRGENGGHLVSFQGRWQRTLFAEGLLLYSG